MAEFRPRRLMLELATGEVEFIVIGGIAAAAWGSIRETNDLDVLCSASPTNLEKLARCLTRIHAKMSGSPRQPQPIVPALLKGWESAVTLVTDYGPLDLLFNARGITYDQIVDSAVTTDVEDVPVLITDIDSLITMKTLAGRPRDLDVVAELRALREMGVTLDPTPP